VRGSINPIGVRVLGRTTVDLDGRTIEIGAAKERAVLTALALAAPRPVSPAELMTVLWDDEPPPTAAKTLQNYIARLRRAIGADVVERLPSGGYAMHVDPARVDARRFEDLVTDAGRALRHGHVGRADQAVSDAVTLWHGTPECGDGTAFGLATVRRFEELWGRLQELRAEVAIALDADPVPVLEAAVALDPHRERLWELLVVALAKSGRQTDALRAVERVRHVLAEVGLVPGEGIRAAERVALGTASVPPTRARQRVLPPQLRRSTGAPLVGRDGVTRDLATAWYEVSRGGSGVVVLEGDAGSGKTRLLVELAALADADGATIAVAAGADRALTPYETLDAAAVSLGSSTDGGASHVREVIATETATDEAQHRRRVLDELRAALASASSNGSLLLVVDDLHWADASTVRALTDLLPVLPSRVMLALAVRPEGLSRPEVVELAATVRRLTTSRWIEATSLDEDALATLVALARPDLAGPEAVARVLFERTSGNAFLATTWLAEPVEDWEAVPSAVRDIVGARLARLHPSLRHTLTAASVVGREVDSSLMAKLLGGTIPEVAAQLDEGIRYGFLEASDVATRYRFVHDLARQAVYEAAPRVERAGLHVAVAAIVEGVADCTEVAHHLVEAGDVADPARTMWACIEASKLASSRCGFEAASTWFERALEADARLPQDPARRTRLLSEQAAALAAAGRPRDAHRVLGVALDTAPDDEPELLVGLLSTYVGAPGTLVDPRDARLRRLVARAAASAPDTRGDLVCQVRCAEVALMANDRDPAPRLEAADEAIALASASGDRQLLARATGVSWLAGQGVRPPSAQLGLTQEWYELAGGLGGGTAAAMPLVRLWTEQISNGAIHEAASSLAELRALADDTRWQLASWYHDLFQSIHHHLEGDLAGAIALANELASRPTTPGPGTGISLQTVRLRLAELAGDLATAASARAALVAIGGPFTASFALDARAAVEVGDLAGATRLLNRWAERALAGSPAVSRVYIAASVAPTAVACGVTGVLEEILHVLEPAAGRWAMMSLVAPLGRIELASGAIRLALGDLDGAVADLAAAHAGHEAAGAPGLLPVSARLLADALSRRGAPQDQRLLASLG